MHIYRGSRTEAAEIGANNGPYKIVRGHGGNEVLPRTHVNTEARIPSTIVFQRGEKRTEGPSGYRVCVLARREQVL